MIGFIGKAITGKMLCVAGGVGLSLLLALAGAGFLLKGAWESTAKAKADVKAAEAAMAVFQDALNAQAKEVEAANQRYIDLDNQFRELQAKKDQIRTVVKTEYRYIRDKAKTDEAVKQYLSAPVPAAINCLLDDTCKQD